MLSTYSPSPEQTDVVQQYRLVAEFPKSRRPTIRDIIMEVAEKHGVTRQDIISPRRGAKLCLARFEGYARARAETGHSLPVIGREFNRDHTTVMHGIERFESLTKNPAPMHVKNPEPRKPKMKKYKTMTPQRIKKAVELRGQGKSWEWIANKFGCSTTTVHTQCYKAAKDNPQYRATLEKSKWLAHQAAVQKPVTVAPAQRKPHRLDPALFITVPSPETRDNELMGTPPLRRSALNKVVTDGRGNIAKRKPIRASIGAISIPDIRINSNGHHA